jgi:hypothetical protein
MNVRLLSKKSILDLTLIFFLLKILFVLTGSLCARQNSAGVYTRVKTALRWIFQYAKQGSKLMSSLNNISCTF